jgi:SM-20-related protein
MMLPNPLSIKDIAAEIERAGYVIVQNFLGDSARSPLASECLDLQRGEQLQPAAIGRAHARRAGGEIRGDQTCWFEPSALTPAQTAYWQTMDALRIELNRALLLGLEELEAHYALYPAGARYARHRDRFRDDDARVLSSVLYLNRDWRDEDGGQLRLYVPQIPYVDVFPTAGTLVLFLSAEFDHEVLPAARERLSVAGWFRRRG